jgi:hypothetical protein
MCRTQYTRGALRRRPACTRPLHHKDRRLQACHLRQFAQTRLFVACRRLKTLGLEQTAHTLHRSQTLKSTNLVVCGMQAYFLHDLIVYIGFFARHEWMFAIHHFVVTLCAPLHPRRSICRKGEAHCVALLPFLPLLIQGLPVRVAGAHAVCPMEHTHAAVDLMPVPWRSPLRNIARALQCRGRQCRGQCEGPRPHAGT